ncbi:MAG TPA: thioredoxin family protein [Candidatus Dormibacteraeota bacterium]
MQVVSDTVREQLRSRFEERLRDPVEARIYLKPGSGRLILPTGMGCPTCEDTRLLLEEVAAQAAGQLSIEVIDITQGVVTEDVLDVPLVTLARAGDPHRVRFLGLPSGFEFGMLVDAIEKLSAGDSGLAADSVGSLSDVSEPIEIMVFATPTCRYCPSAVGLATGLAVASPEITAVTVSANEFPRLSQAFGVQGVPRTVVNRRGAFVGAVPEPDFVRAVLQIAGALPEEADQPVEEGASTAL